MGLETGTYISDLVTTNPAGGDAKSQGDDHLRLIKSTIVNTFPAITGAVTATHDELNLLDGVTATTAEINILDGVTSTATELNVLDGITTTTIELNYVSGVTSSIQTQIDTINTDKADIAGPTFTGTVTLPSTTSIGSVDSTELSYLNGVTSAIQTQINTLSADKADLDSPALTGTPTAPTATVGTDTTQLATTAFVNSTAMSTALPAQTGNSGKFVTTDGTNASWATVGVKTAITLDAESNGLVPVILAPCWDVTYPNYQPWWGTVSVANDVFFFATTGTSAETIIRSSTDGVTWTDRTMPSSRTWVKVCWTGTNYVCISYNGTAAAYSTNYISWNASTLATATTTYGLASDGAGTVVTSNTASTTIQRSTDHGVTWANVTAPVTTEGVEYIGSLFVMFASANSTSYYTSSTGSTWTTQTFPDSKTISAGRWATDGTSLYVVTDDGYFYSTTDGTTWTQEGQLPKNYTANPHDKATVNKINGVWVCLSNDNADRSGVWYSHDGATWYQFLATLQGVTSYFFGGNGNFVIGTGGAVSFQSLTTYQPIKFDTTKKNLYEN